MGGGKTTDVGDNGTTMAGVVMGEGDGKGGIGTGHHQGIGIGLSVGAGTGTLTGTGLEGIGIYMGKTDLDVGS